MSYPVNRIASDREIVEAVKKHKDRRAAAESLGMAYKTLSNRLSLMKHKQPEEQRPSTYKHTGCSRYFISCAVSDAPISKRFYESVQVMCDHLEAEQIYIPVQYDWNDVKTGKHEPIYPSQLSDKMLSEDVKLNNHLLVMGSVPIHATIQNPLTGLNHVSHNKSAIFAHPQRAMQSIPTPKVKLPKLLYTTGAITEPRYTRSKTGRKAQDHHTIGGLIVEVTSDRFHVFEVTANEKGEFYHLTEYFTPEGVKEHDGIAAVYMADEHAEYYPDNVKLATYTDGRSIVSTLLPDEVVRGDVYNHGSDNHHERKNVLNRIIRSLSGAHNVKDELDHCFFHIKETSNGAFKNVVVASNHHDHLKRWLNEYNPHTGDPVNALLYHQLNALMIEEAIESGHCGIDPFVSYCRANHPEVYDLCVFVGRDEEYKSAGVDVSMHGDIGSNGSRGSAVNLSLGGQPVIIGHSHSPRIYRNVHQVGASSMEMGYNVGNSGWMTTHCAIYPDGAKTLIHIIDGEWRL